MASDKKNVHAGHRERMRSKYLRVGIEGFEEHEILEMLLYSCFAQQNTNALAHELISNFGSLDGVFSASIPELKAIKGIGDIAAFNIKLVGDMISRGNTASDKRPILNTTDKIVDYLTPFFKSARNETVVAVSLDQNLRVMRTTKIHEGSFDSVSFPIVKIVRNLVSCSTMAVIISHNHPLGFALPSVQDIRTTEKLKSALESVGIMFVDHVILGADGFVSFRDSADKLYAITQ